MLETLGPPAVLAVAIFVILFIMILLPKAIKGWNVSWGSGFERIYYVAAFFLALAWTYETKETGGLEWWLVAGFWFLLLVVGFKIFKWIFGGFIKKKK